MYLLYALLLCIPFVYGMDANAKGTGLKVLGQSGKVDITRNGKVITMEFDSMVEKDTNGDEVGMTGSLSTKHGVKSFATQNFQFSELSTVEYKNVSMETFSFTSSINTIGELKVDIFIVNKNGTIKNGDESFNVVEGDVKWNIVIPRWTFGASGAYIDLDIEIKDKNGTTVSGSFEDYNVGDSQLQMSKNVFRDGTYKSMPLSFPKLKKIGSKKVFSFRFEKFTSNMTYDPVFAFTEKREPSRVSVWGLIEIVVVIMVCIAVFFSLWLYFK